MVLLYQTAVHWEQTAKGKIMQPSSEQTLMSIKTSHLHASASGLIYVISPFPTNTCFIHTGLLSAWKETISSNLVTQGLLYLWFPDFNNPRGRYNDPGVCAQRARFLDLLQHETRHLVVELRRRAWDTRVNTWASGVCNSVTFRLKQHSLPACTTSSWWR